MKNVHATFQQLLRIPGAPQPISDEAIAEMKESAAYYRANIFDLLAYSPDVPSGLVWKVNRTAGVRAGDMAGTKSGIGYYQISLSGKRFSAHRVVWEMHFGPVPKGMQVDHRDRNMHNNNVSNLRLATANQNQSNRIQTLPATGVRGVSRERSGFVAQVKFKGVPVRKRFRDLSQAAEWVESKRKEMHGEFAVAQP